MVLSLLFVGLTSTVPGADPPPPIPAGGFGADAAPSGPGAAEADSIEAALDLLREVFAGIQEVYVEPVSVRFLLDAALEGLHEQLDPHTKVLTPAEFTALRSRDGASVGIGVTLDFSADEPRVVQVRPDSPAHEAGLRPGDRLVSIGGVPLNGLQGAQVVDHLRGPVGTLVRLETAPPGRSVRTLEIRRRLVTRDALSHRRLADGRLGYLEIRRFARGVSERIEQVLAEWSAEDLQGLVIDLRDNPGGFLDEAARSADLFLPLGAEIVRTVGRLPEENGVMVSRRLPLSDHTLAILVDSLTASSAEVFAGALKGRSRVVLVGERSYGKRTVQRLRPLSGGGALKVTASFYQTPADAGDAVTTASPLGVAAPPVAPAEISASESLPERVGARGRRLQPDRIMERPPEEDPLVELQRSGLLQRFVQEETCTPASPGLAFWRRSQAPDARCDARPHGDRSETRAPGFDRWCALLGDRLRQWGGAAAPPVSARLRAIWFADWVQECWGEEAGRRAQLELDPWVRAAAQEIHARGPREGSDPSAVTAEIVPDR